MNQGERADWKNVGLEVRRSEGNNILGRKEE
jgi:hypothetical protein